MKNLKYQVNLRVFDHHADTFIPLECKNYVKYLGVLVDESLSWKHHIPHIASKIIISVGIISRLRHFVTFSTLRHIYKSLIQPYPLYGLVARVKLTRPIETDFYSFKNVPFDLCSL